MKVGRLIGTVILVLGIIAIASMYIIFSSTNYLPKFVASGPALIIVGLAMYIFPGGDVTNKELNAKTKAAGFMWTDAPLLHKIIWIFALLIGVAASLYQMISIGFL
jgi:hypothetical protein